MKEEDGKAWLKLLEHLGGEKKSKKLIYKELVRPKNYMIRRNIMDYK